MGQIISTIFGYRGVQYSELPKEDSSKITKEMFEDLSKYPDIVDKFGSITKDKLNIPIEDMNEFIDDLVDFIEEYIDLTQMGGKHSKLWNGYVHHESKIERLLAIKVKVIEILKIDESSEKSDKNLGVYLKKIITHLFGDQCGGFTLTDTRETKDISPIKYMHLNKMENMREHIKYVLKLPGFVFCTEYDWENCLDESCTGIKYHQFNKDIHKDNSAKALFYSDTLVMREFERDEIESMMVDQKQTSHIENYEKYKEKFTVFTIYNPYANEGELFHDEVIVIGIHATSIGSKSAISSNLDEYRFLKTVIQSYKNFNSIIIGDLNLPEFSEGREYFGLCEEDRLTYPIQNSFNSDFVDKSTFMTEGYERYSLYEMDTVASKERTGQAYKNSQSVVGKNFIREYCTDNGYGRFNIGVKTKGSLYPPNTKESNIIIPIIAGGVHSDWLSDHQSSIMTMTDSKENSYNMSAYNVLSKCCSGGQPLKDSLTSHEIDIAGYELCDILAELTNIILENISA